jgi:hypothetical protein
MRSILFLFLFFIQYTAFSQDIKQEIAGIYTDSFGSSVELRKNLTFRYLWSFDLASSWTNGTWIIVNDTIFLKKIIFYDTLITDDNKVSIIISDDNQRDKFYQSNMLTFGAFSSGGQDRNPPPMKLYFNDEKLYRIDKNGKLLKKRVKGFWTQKKVPSWYRKEIN